MYIAHSRALQYAAVRLTFTRSYGLVLHYHLLALSGVRIQSFESTLRLPALAMFCVLLLLTIIKEARW